MNSPRACLMDSFISAYISTPAKRKAALTTPIKAPPAMNPEASKVPLFSRALFKSSSLLRVDTYQLISPPTTKGVFK